MRRHDSGLDVLCRLAAFQTLGFLPRNGQAQPISIEVKGETVAFASHASHLPEELQHLVAGRLLRSATDAVNAGDVYRVNFSALGGQPIVELNGELLPDDDHPARKQLLADAQTIRNEMRSALELVARMGAPRMVDVLRQNRDMIRALLRRNDAATPTGQRQLRVVCTCDDDRTLLDPRRATELETTRTAGGRILAFSLTFVAPNQITSISGPYLDWLVEALINELLTIADPECFPVLEC